MNLKKWSEQWFKLLLNSSDTFEHGLSKLDYIEIVIHSLIAGFMSLDQQAYISTQIEWSSPNEFR